MFQTRTEHQEDIPYTNENSPLAGSGEQERYTIPALQETWYTQPNRPVNFRTMNTKVSQMDEMRLLLMWIVIIELCGEKTLLYMKM